MTDHIEDRAIRMVCTLRRALVDAGELIESLQAGREQIRRDLLAMREERDMLRSTDAALRAELDALRAQLEAEKGKPRCARVRNEAGEPTVIEGWEILSYAPGFAFGAARRRGVERCCHPQDDGSCKWSPRGLAEVPERVRLEVEYQLLSARARREGWTWRGAMSGGLCFQQGMDRWYFANSFVENVIDPPSYIRALAERAERRISG